ncbi:MAG: DUF6526 family protein [Acidobacteriota bacterium]
MAETPAQDFKTHRRWDPPYHYFAAPVLVIAFFVALWHAFKAPSGWTIWQIFVSAAVVVIVWKARSFALRAQDRVIRLEERQRLAAVLEGPLRARSLSLTEDQLIGLRFAPDAELAGLVEVALDENLSGEAIKKRIANWRPDTFRV